MWVVHSARWKPGAVKIAETWRRFGSADMMGKIRLAKRLVRLFAWKVLASIPRLGLNLIARGRPVRMGTLNAKGRWSIMISYIEPYMRRLQLEGARNPLLIVINPGITANDQLARMYKRSLWLLDDERPWLRNVFAAWFRLLSAAQSPEAASLYSGIRCEYARAWREGSPVLRFSPEEEKAGQSFLAALGIPMGAPYMCFGLREAAYYQQFLLPETQARHPNPEAGEDSYIRNPLLANYLPMAAQCAAQGLYVLRMGYPVGEPLPPGLHPDIIDYVSQYRTAFGDIYLLATCKFVVAGAAGLWWISSAFNRPVALTDSYCLQVRGLRPGDLFIPAKLWLISEKRLLAFREMLQAGMEYSVQSNCIRDGIELVHNTPDEIAAVAQEMVQRLDGTWQTNEEDEELQRRFDALYAPEHIGYGLPARIGAEFLRRHSSLL